MVNGMNEIIKDILQSYRVYPTKSEKITNRLYRVQDGGRTYALKQSTLAKEDIAIWQHVYGLANEFNLSEVAPVYLTREGQLYVELDESFYYLTPWVETTPTNNLKSNIENTMQNLGNLHEKTKKSHRITKEALQEKFFTYQTYSREVPIKLKRIVHQFENNRYMSPFELLVCTQYRDVEYALKLSNEAIEQFLEPSDDELTWNYCLCHGNLTPDHTVSRYIINWENAHFDHPAMDLVKYFSHLTGSYDQPPEMITNAFKLYKNKNDLNQMELKLLTIYLLHPSSYITTIQNYVNSTSQKSMAYQIRDIQQQFRMLLFAIKWNEFIIEEYETISFEDADL